MEKKILVIIYILSMSVIFAGSPRWVRTFGVQTPYGEDFLVGFGMSASGLSDRDTLEGAKALALSDMIRKVSVLVTTELTESIQETEGNPSAYITSVTKSSSQLSLPGVDFLVEEQDGTVYVLAFAEKRGLINIFKTRAERNLELLLQLDNEALNREKQQNNVQAASFYARTLPLYDELYRDLSLIMILSDEGLGEIFPFVSDDLILNSIEDLIYMENSGKSRIEKLRHLDENNLDQALDNILFLLKEQGVRGGRLQNPALTFQQTDFSSPFGKYAAEKLAHVLGIGLEGNGPATIIRGSYWIESERVEILVQAFDPETESVIGSASASLIRDSIPENLIVEPQNNDQALIDLMEFREAALTDGSIHVDLWTNKGRNEDVLIYSQGDELQLYFRVNQPCFLQLSYFLASGERVLLEEKFYIGIDRVNRVVPLPYQFEVIPPFGVERLVVSAFSTEPPIPNVVPAIIDGERYMVFPSMEAAMAQTRGIRRKSNSQDDSRSGEAQLAITTLPK